MTLPQALQAGIDGIVAGGDRREVERAARALSDSYRAGGSAATRAARTNGDVVAYLATRAPATYAAAAAVFEQIRLARPEWAPTSVVDLGAGPGIAAWAAAEAWPAISTVSLVEAEPEMERAGKALAADGPAALRDARWTVADAGGAGAKADLVLVSYVIGELEPPALAGFVDHAWSLAGDTLVIVEPGTTAGYEGVLRARAAVTAAGGSTLAPCPHDNPCPLSKGDWCHFATRLPRSRTHRLAKGAERGFEDEKFAYAVLCRGRHLRLGARIIRRPDLRQGHVVLDLCTTEGLERRTVSKRDGADYRKARKLGMGRHALSRTAALRYVGAVQRVAVVTGASSGIGEATARLLAARGWRCVLVARREDRLRALAAETGGEVEPCDIGDRAAVEALAARVLERHPSIQALVNNAGMPARRSFSSVDLDLVEEVARVNYLGGIWLTRGLLPGLRPTAGGPRAHIVNVTSVAGAVASAPSGAYTAAKHAQLAFSRSLQATLRGSGIAVHTILPGFVQTDGFPQQALLEHRFMRHIVVQPERVAEAIAKALEGRRGREIVVPWFPYRPAIVLYGVAPGLLGKLGDRAVAKNRAFRAKAAEGE